jgi:hypothetical protein
MDSNINTIPRIDKMITWAIETGIETEYEMKLVESAKKFGCNVYSPSFIPFGVGLADPLLEVEGRIIFHGSLQGAKHAREDHGWEVHENAEELCCKYYYPRLIGKILNTPHTFIPYGCLNLVKEGLFKSFGQEDCIFVRPDSNRKIFTGTLVKREFWKERVELIGFYEVKPEELCVVAPPVNIEKEWRFFVSNGKIITGSLYRDGSRSVRVLANEADTASAKELLDYCTEQGYNPDSIWVMDMCETRAGRRCILEVGSFSSSGLYACDTDKIVEAVINL